MAPESPNQQSPLVSQVQEHVKFYQPAMGLEKWTIRLMASDKDGEGEKEPCKASCQAAPEYRDAMVTFTFDRFETGDDVEEIVVHELSHCLTWPQTHIADVLAGEDPKLKEWARLECERVCTDVGEVILALARELKETRKALKEARKRERAATAAQTEPSTST
jgi:hypothetical protein